MRNARFDSICPPSNVFFLSFFLPFSLFLQWIRPRFYCILRRTISRSKQRISLYLWRNTFERARGYTKRIITFDQIFRYTFWISESADVSLINRSLRYRQVFFFFFTNKHGITYREVDISTMNQPSRTFQLRVIPRRGDNTGSPSPNLVASDRELIIVSSLNPTRSARNFF